MFLTSLISILSITELYNLPFASGIELDYEELNSINGSCFPMDSCQDDRPPKTADEVVNNLSFTCTCNRLCSKYGTCCIDSLHRENMLPNTRPECRKMKGEFTNVGYYMVDKCSTGGEFDSMWKIPCEANWKDKDNAVFPLAPVTSLFSSITYKNYFCLRCHEKTNDFLYWNIVLTGYYNGSANVKKDFAEEDYIVKYSNRRKTWMAIVGRDNVLVPVKMRFEIPSHIKSMNVLCDPNTIFKCSKKWTDDSVREKCNAYQAIIYIKRDDKYLKYQNPHCALCNFESLEGRKCYKAEFVKVPLSSPFNFSHTVDVNRFHGDKLIPMKEKCGKNLVWDPFGAKCRKLSCSDPRLEIRDEMCVPHFNFHENPENFFFHKRMMDKYDY